MNCRTIFVAKIARLAQHSIDSRSDNYHPHHADPSANHQPDPVTEQNAMSTTRTTPTAAAPMSNYELKT